MMTLWGGGRKHITIRPHQPRDTSTTTHSHNVAQQQYIYHTQNDRATSRPQTLTSHQHHHTTMEWTVAYAYTHATWMAKVKNRDKSLALQDAIHTVSEKERDRAVYTQSSVTSTNKTASQHTHTITTTTTASSSSQHTKQHHSTPTYMHALTQNWHHSTH